MAVYRYKTPADQKKLAVYGSDRRSGTSRVSARPYYGGSRTRMGAEQQARMVRDAKGRTGAQAKKKRIMKAYMVRVAVRKMRERKEQAKQQEQEAQRSDASAVSQSTDKIENAAEQTAVTTAYAIRKYVGSTTRMIYGAAREHVENRSIRKSVRRIARRYRGADGKVRISFRYEARRKNMLRSVRLKKDQRYRIIRGRHLLVQRTAARRRNGTAGTVYGAADKAAVTVYDPSRSARIKAAAARAQARTAVSGQFGKVPAAARSSRRNGFTYRLHARKAGIRKLKKKQWMQRITKSTGSTAKRGLKWSVRKLAEKAAAAVKGKAVLIGAVVAVIACMIIAPFSIIASPLGILFADENTTDVNAHSVQQAYMEAQAAWTDEVVSGESYSYVEYEGTYADSIEILAVFAVRVTEIDGLDAMTMGDEQREILSEVYMDMNPYRKWITVTEDGTRILHVRVSGLTADEAADQYHFTNSQRVMLHELLEDYRDELSALLNAVGGSSLSQAVLALRELVEKYAAKYGISEYVDLLLAIIQVESGGLLEDVMQSSESMGLPPNSLGKEASINQGCKYFAGLVDKADRLGCDMDSVIQAYNYGSGFLDFVARNGKKYSFDLAQEFARQQSGGVRVPYKNEISVAENGGWRYNYGNMFYVRLVKQYNAGLGTDMQNRIVTIAQNYQSYGITAPAGYCEMWAEQVYRAAGVQVNNWCCAGRNRMTNVVSHDSSNIPIGAMVYNDPAVYNSRTTCGCGLNAGHVGIYLGNGQIMSNIGGSAIDTLESWTSYYGFGGWGWGGAAVN